MIQDAATSYDQTVDYRADNAAQAIEKANEIADNTFKLWIEPEIKYGHFSVSIDDYINTLVLHDSRTREAFFDILEDAGYDTKIRSFAISDVRVANSGVLVISWEQRPREEKID